MGEERPDDDKMLLALQRVDVEHMIAFQGEPCALYQGDPEHGSVGCEKCDRIIKEALAALAGTPS